MEYLDEGVKCDFLVSVLIVVGIVYLESDLSSQTSASEVGDVNDYTAGKWRE